MNKAAGPRTEPPVSEIHIAQYPWTCFECRVREPEGTTFAWLTNPYKEIGKRDHKVHVNHWHDVEYEIMGEDQPDLEEYDQPIEEAVETGSSFAWAVQQLREGVTVRRAHWKSGKYLKLAIRFDLPIISVYTNSSKHAFSYPDYDTDATDWYEHKE